MATIDLASADDPLKYIRTEASGHRRVLPFDAIHLLFISRYGTCPRLPLLEDDGRRKFGASASADHRSKMSHNRR